MSEQYWRPAGYNVQSADMEFRADMAWRLLEHHGAIAGKRPGGILGDGDPGVELQTPEELVARCFRIADLFVEEAQRRGLIRPVDPAREHAEIEARNDAEAEREADRIRKRYPNMGGR